jgi:Raf kinase inhibitor-like YbhB/YbcL family protein
MELTSSAFPSGSSIPVDYTGDGRDVSPPLMWDHVPQGTQELALLCDDPDAPSSEPWVHWLVYKIPATSMALPEGIGSRSGKSSDGLRQGHNSWQSGKATGYRGPAPPRGHGVHHYHFHLYALDKPLPLQAGATKAELLKAMQGHVLAEAELVATYQR